MRHLYTYMRAVLLLGALALAGCGGSVEEQRQNFPGAEREGEEEIWDIVNNQSNPDVTVAVNKYIWNAALDVLNFLPVESADPFTGVIVFGYGTPPGGGRAYRATVLVQDASLEARALKVSLLTRSGPAAPDTVRAVEDAILTRARELRIADDRL
ncbi:MAG: DUF3576 domain-containing protein [Rhodobacteraceae bacterium]|nr:DUF3576 domain-containing protein [Paracoccaceae bacterium]